MSATDYNSGGFTVSSVPGGVAARVLPLVVVGASMTFNGPPAHFKGVKIEISISRDARALLARSEKFKDAANYVLEKNRRLYEHLG